MSALLSRSQAPGARLSNDETALVERVPERARVLALGDRDAVLTRALFEQRSCLIDLVEADPVSAVTAGEWCQRLWIRDLNRCRLTELVGDTRYDVVLMTDVLEQQLDPAALLMQVAHCTRISGCVLLSVFNAANRDVLVPLLNGRFDYRERGGIDPGHLRFYTRQTIEELSADVSLHLHWCAGVNAENDIGSVDAGVVLAADMRSFFDQRLDTMPERWLFEFRHGAPRHKVNIVLGEQSLAELNNAESLIHNEAPPSPSIDELQQQLEDTEHRLQTLEHRLQQRSQDYQVELAVLKSSYEATLLSQSRYIDELLERKRGIMDWFKGFFRRRRNPR